MMKAIAIAFSTYSKIPMPHFKWDPKALQYSMCAFPLVGAVIGAGEFAIWYLFGFLLQWSEVFTAALLTVFPILITGGIHMDGFLDTVDAKSSYKSKEEKLQILKDPHTGAFAIIRGCLYFLIYFGCMYELVTASSVKLAAGVQTAGAGEAAVNGSLTTIGKDGNLMRMLAVFAIGFILERTLSGLSVLTFQKAKKEGMLADTARLVNNRSKGIMFVWLIACIAAGCVIQPVAALVVAGIAILMFFYYRFMSYRTFGGITGDLAGYFLQMCELWMLIGTVVLVHVI